MRLATTIFLFFCNFGTSAEEFPEKKYKLLSIDSVLLSDYYIMSFAGPDSMVNILSPKVAREFEGCWEVLKVGNEYYFSTQSIDKIYSPCSDIYFPIRNEGLLFIDNDTLLADTKNLLKSDQIKCKYIRRK